MLILIVTIPSLVTNLRQHALDTQEPVPVAGIAKLIEDQAGAREMVSERQISAENAPSVDDQPPDQAPANATPSLPDHLAFTATRELAVVHFAMREDPKWELVEMTAARAFEHLYWAIGLDDSAQNLSVQLGENYFFAREWDTACGYFESVLRMPGGAGEKRVAAARLAWLESDPQRAAYLLELSCCGNEPGPLTDAVALCRMTGSEVLSEHYEARLREAKRRR